MKTYLRRYVMHFASICVGVLVAAATTALVNVVWQQLAGTVNLLGNITMVVFCSVVAYISRKVFLLWGES